MNRKKIIFPILVIVVSSVVTLLLVQFGRRAQPVPPDPLKPVVYVERVAFTSRVFEVLSQGTVQAATSIPIISELDGVVTEAAPFFHQGGFFQQGDVFLRLDPTDYQTLVAQAESQLASARLKLETVQAESKLARQDWESLASHFTENATPLLLREPQLEESQAVVRATEAGLAKAQKDLQRTEVRAPFDGRIVEKLADRGQFIRRGQEVARVFDVSKVEVALPVAVSELAFLDQHLGFPAGHASGESVRVILTGDYAGQEHVWEGQISRTSGGLDARSRMISLVAEVEDPFGLHANSEVSAPLQVGAFVQARIQGVEKSGVFSVTRSAILDGSEVLLVDDANRIRRRKVDVLRYEGEMAIIGSGLKHDEIICVSTLEIPKEGAEVEPVFQKSGSDQ